MSFRPATTRAQREAFKRLYDRTPLFVGSRGRNDAAEVRGVHKPGFVGPISYTTFRRLATVTSDCMMVPWCGMWLGIETDGYTHS